MAFHRLSELMPMPGRAAQPRRCGVVSEHPNRFRLQLSCGPDVPLWIGLMTGEASSWRVAARLLDEGEFHTPEEAERHTEITFRRFASVVEGLIGHPRQCAYAIAIAHRRAMPMEWAMSVVENSVNSDIAQAALDLARCGAPADWVRRMVMSHSTGDKADRILSLLEVGAASRGEAEVDIERMGDGAGRLAVIMATRFGSSYGWATRIVLSDPTGRLENMDALRASCRPGVRPAVSSMSRTQRRKLRRSIW